MLYLGIKRYLIFSTLLFSMGVCGIVFNRTNLITIIMSIEIMLLAVNFNFLVFSSFIDDLAGQIFALFILTVAAAESAIGLAILVLYFKVKGTIFIDSASAMRG